MQSEMSIHQAVSAIIGEMSGIGKNQRNKDQGYNFRGIDDVLKELHPLFARHGVFFAPTVLERIYEERISAKGNVGHICHLHVAYKVYGPMGDFIEISTWGEGLDYSDKCTNKAMTAAFKYAMFELFAIADPDDDADHNTEDGGFDGAPIRKPGEYKNNVRQEPYDYSRPPIQEGAGYIFESGNEEFDIIMQAGVVDSSNDFIQSLIVQIMQRGTLTPKQLESGVKSAKRIMGQA
jgi:hypothetical protein